jgi:ABC-type nickel/cobalt efflux system permease component RcnA
MGRIVFFLIAFGGAWLFFRSWQRKALKKHHSSTHQHPDSCRKTEQEVLPCLHCGVYSPMSTGLMQEGRFYCGVEHAKAAGEAL